jgi:flagellar biosynthesis protein FlhG
MTTIISVASGKGGVGKSMVACNLALVLSKRGKTVTLVDLDTGGANLHILFGLFHPTTTLTDFLEHRTKTIQATTQKIPGFSNLSLIAGTGETLLTANLQFSKKKRLIAHLKKLEGDFVIIDVGAGTNYHVLDFFLCADQYITVATPDPTSVLDLYRFIKLAALRKVLSSYLARDPITRNLADNNFQSLDEILEAVGETNESGKHVAEHALQDFNPSLILNRMTNGSRVNTLHLQQMVKDYIGTNLEVLGEIPDDPAVEQSVRKYLPVVEFSPQSPASLAFENITKNLTDWLQSKISIGEI